MILSPLSSQIPFPQPEFIRPYGFCFPLCCSKFPLAPLPHQSLLNFTIFRIPISTHKGHFFFFFFNSFGAALRWYSVLSPLSHSDVLFFLCSPFNHQVIFSICFHFDPSDFCAFLQLAISSFLFHSPKAHYLFLGCFLRQLFTHMGQETFPLMLFLIWNGSLTFFPHLS